MPFLGTTGGGSVKQYGGQANLGYFIKNSLRTRASANGYLSRTPPSGSGGQSYTISVWVKRGTLGTVQAICSANYTNSTFFDVIFNTGNTLEIYLDAGTGNYSFVSTSVYRDPSAWYHIVIAGDHTNATAANRLKVYVNGVAAPGTYTYPATNFSTSWNIGTRVHGIGVRPNSSFQWYFDGYMAEFNSVDGQTLTPSSFGKTDSGTGQWIPKKFAGTYGTNGFYLKFADTSAATAAAIGKDSSGNGNNWTPRNISVTAGVTYDAMIDSPTLSAVASNYATWNPLNAVQSTLSQGNLYSSATGSSTYVLSTFPTATTGKWYMEIVLDFTVNINWPIVMGASDGGNTYLNLYTDWSARAINKSVNGTTSSVTPSGNFPANGDILKIAYDADAGKLWLGLNSNWYGTTGSLTGDPATGADATLSGATGKQIYPWHSSAGGPAQNAYLNCGQRPFAYTPPTGFKSLNTYNLP